MKDRVFSATRAILPCLLLIACTDAPRAPSDDQLGNIFESNVSLFEDAKDVLLASQSPRDIRVARKGSEFDLSGDVSGLTVREKATLVALAEETPLVRISSSGGEPGGQVSFSMHAAGLGIAGADKGILYSERPVEHRVENTDEALRRAGGKYVAAERALGRGWYIYLSSN